MSDGHDEEENKETTVTKSPVYSKRHTCYKFLLDLASEACQIAAGQKEKEDYAAGVFIGLTNVLNGIHGEEKGDDSDEAVLAELCRLVRQYKSAFRSFARGRRISKDKQATPPPKPATTGNVKRKRLKSTVEMAKNKASAKRCRINVKRDAEISSGACTVATWGQRISEKPDKERMACELREILKNRFEVGGDAPNSGSLSLEANFLDMLPLRGTGKVYHLVLHEHYQTSSLGRTLCIKVTLLGQLGFPLRNMEYINASVSAVVEFALNASNKQYIFLTKNKGHGSAT
ncbi:MAG: hypothetical protein ACREOZ_00300 [Gloeomargaritales cyanobacterium]